MRAARPFRCALAGVAAATAGWPVAWGADPAVPAAPEAKVDALGDPLPEGAIHRFGTRRLHASSTVYELALSPDEQTVVTIGKDLIAWDTATGKARWQVPGTEFGVRFSGVSYGLRPLAFAPGGQQFFTPGRDGSIVLWSTLTGERQELPVTSAAEPRALNEFVANARDGIFRAIDSSPSGKLLALGNAAGVLVVRGDDSSSFQIVNRPQANMRVGDGNDRLRFAGHGCFVRIAPDEESLAVMTSDTPQVICIVDAKDGSERSRVELGAWLVKLVYSPDGNRIFTTERDSAVRCYEVASGQRLWSQEVELKDPSENYTAALAVSPDGRIVAASATDNKLYLFDADDGSELGRLSGHSWYPWALDFTRDSKTLYSSGWDGAVRRWDVAERRQLPLPQGVWGSDVSAASPDGRTLAWQDGWGVIHVVDAASGAELRTLELEETRYSQVEFSPDGRLLAAGGGTGPDNQVSVWEVASGKLVHRWLWPRGHDPKSTVESLRFSADGRRLAAAVFRQSMAYLWDLETDKQIAKLAHNSVYGLSFAPDGELATAGWDRKLMLWDGETGTLNVQVNMQPLFPQDNELRMYTVVHAAEGGLLATIHLQGTVRIWQGEPLALRREFANDGRFSFGAACFSPDGLWLATGGSTGAVTLWDPTTGEKVWDVGRHANSVYQMSFGRDSRTLLSGGNDGVSYLWNLRPAERAARVDDPPALWQALCGDDSSVAYAAMWALGDLGDEALPLLAEKLRAVQAVCDPQQVVGDGSVEQRLQLELLQKRLAAGGADVVTTRTARRALAVLAQIGTPRAIELLDQLAAAHAASELGAWAKSAGQRAARAE